MYLKIIHVSYFSEKTLFNECQCCFDWKTKHLQRRRIFAVIHVPVDVTQTGTRRNNNVIITSKRRRVVVLTLLLRRVTPRHSP